MDTALTVRHPNDETSAPSEHQIDLSVDFFQLLRTAGTGQPNWSTGTSDLLMVPQFIDVKYFKEYEFALWQSAMACFNPGTLDFLARPDYDPGGRSKIVLIPPVQDVLTAASYDVEETLARLKHRFVDKCGFQLVFVHGDQQTYSRMLALQYAKGDLYNWLVPLPGEWHFVAHALNSIHNKKSGWWAALINWFPDSAGLCQGAVLEEWTSIEKYDIYCSFYEAVIVSVMEFLHQVVPPFYLNHPTILLQLLENENAEGGSFAHRPWLSRLWARR